MSDRANAKVQSPQKMLTGSSHGSCLLQRTCACGQHTIAGSECSTCRNERSTLLGSQRAFGPPSALGTVLGNSPAQENGTSFNSAFDSASRFGYDFSRIPIHSTQPAALQTKLTVNQPGDVYEQEADQVSEQVMRVADLESPTSDDEDEAKNSLMRKQSGQTGVHVATSTLSVPPVVHDVLNSGGGQPLDATTRAFMEPRFGHDFSRVRVHTDERAAESARAVNALAYTVGRDIVFGAGQFASGMDAGRRLVAHELAHVVQQKQNIHQQPISQQQPITILSQEGDAEEIEARRAANEVTLGQRTTISTFPQKSTLSLMRQIPPLPGAPEVLSRLSDEQLKQRSDQIYEQAVSVYMKQRGKPITKETLGMLRKELTVGVLQGVKDGKVVTMVNGHNPDFADFVKASLKSGEEYIESIEAIPENVRTGEPRKSGHIYVHAEQVLASEAKVRSVSDARVGTSNNACNDLCISNLSENYPEVFHVNPAKPRKTTTPVEPAPSSNVSSPEAKGAETPETKKVTTVPKPPVDEPKPTTGLSVEPPGGNVRAPEDAAPDLPGTAPKAGLSTSEGLNVEGLSSTAARGSGIGTALGAFQLALLALQFIPDPVEKLVIEEKLDQELKSSKWRARLAELEPLVHQSPGVVYYTVKFKILYSVYQHWHWRATPIYTVKSIEVLELNISNTKIEDSGKLDPPSRPEGLGLSGGGAYGWEANRVCTLSILPVRPEIGPTYGLTGDTEIRNAINKADATVIAGIPTEEKIWIINRLFDFWVSDDDIAAISKIYKGTPSSQQSPVKEAIEKRIPNLTSIGQRTRLRVILAGG